MSTKDVGRCRGGLLRHPRELGDYPRELGDYPHQQPLLKKQHLYLLQLFSYTHSSINASTTDFKMFGMRPSTTIAFQKAIFLKTIGQASIHANKDAHLVFLVKNLIKLPN